MALTEGQKEAQKKYKAKSIKYFNLAMKKEFARHFENFFKGEAGKRYKSRTAFVVQAIKEKMEADGYHFDEEKE